MSNRLFLLRFALFIVLAAGLVVGCRKESRGPGEEAKPAGPAPETDPVRIVAQMLQDYQKKTSANLKAALAEKGTVGAMEVCANMTLQLEDEFAKMPETEVRRVSDRARSPVHEPDAFEAAVLKEWQQELAEGKHPTTIVRETEDGRRLMHPITIGAQLCLRCHGQRNDMTVDTVKYLAETYPWDTAVGYQKGDLRGAYSVVWWTPEAKARRLEEIKRRLDESIRLNEKLDEQRKQLDEESKKVEQAYKEYLETVEKHKQQQEAAKPE